MDWDQFNQRVARLQAMSSTELSGFPLMHEGKAKRVRECPEDRDFIVMEFKDSLTAFDAIKKAERSGKGALNCAISTFMMESLRATNIIPTAFICQLSPTHQLMRRCKVVPLEVIVRNEAQGSFCKRYGLEPGTPFPSPLTEIGLKNDALHDPFFTNDDIPIDILQLLTEAEMRIIRELARSANHQLTEIFLQHRIRLLDLKFEFGRRYDTGQIVLIDEINGDTCRLVDAITGEKLDKDNFRFDLGDVMAGYVGLARHLLLDVDAILKGIDTQPSPA